MAGGKEIKNLFATVKGAVVGAYNTAKSKINKLRAKPKKKNKKKKKDTTPRAGGYADYSARQKAMDDAGNIR